MAIKVRREALGTTEGSGVVEDCCVCGRPTTFWFVPKDVAVCSECARSVEPADLPTKEEWCSSGFVPKAKRDLKKIRRRLSQ